MTISVNELRIGNLVFDYGIITEVNGFLLTRLEEINNEGKLVVNISPIPLTEEWLIKFGFYKNEYGYWKNLGHGFNFHVLFIGGEFSFCVSSIGETKLKHVHQLQNLYFSLVGEELEIK